jgi:uncharacterized repeat protein (TIGR01451 family)
VDGGGGIWNSGGVVTMNTSQVISNTAANNGGGIWNLNGALTVNTSQILTNTSNAAGGGIFNQTSSSDNVARLTLNTSTIGGNQAVSGGGIRNLDSALTLNGSTLHDNQADNGGALFNGGRLEVVISNSTVNSNTVTMQGGGIFNSDGSIILDSSTLSSNRAETGGGIFNQNGTLTLHNGTIAYNVATSRGGGLVNRDGMLALHNVIVAYSSGGDCAGTLLSEGYNLDTDSTCNLTEPGDRMEIDPQIGPLQDNGGPTFTHALLPGSRAIDGGVCGAIITDQRGEPRPGFGSSFCDVGAFERQNVSADLSISKYVDPVGTLVPGQPITYTLVYTNVGVARGGEIVIDDVLPDTLSNFSYTSSGPEVVETGSTPYRWQIDDLGPMDQGIITITARIRPDLASRTSFVNRARINSLTIVDVMPENNFSSVENRVLLPRVAFSSADYIVEEATAQAVITVTLDPVPQVPVRVDYATRDSIAIAPDDYTATSGTLAFNAGQRVGTFVIPINRDTNLESAETVRLILNNPVNAEIGIPSTATLTIINSAVQRLYMPLAVTP